MKRNVKILLVLFFSMLLIGCWNQKYPYELVEVNQKNVQEANRFCFVDLNGDTEDELLVMRDCEGQFTETTVRDGDFNIFSQLNNSLYINRISYYDVDNDGEKELFFSGVNNEREIYVNQVDYEWIKDLQRIDKLLYKVKRRDDRPPYKRCYGSFGIVDKDDINDDGKEELILTGSSSFGCFPRGIFAIDAETGKEVWNYETAGNLCNYYYADINYDGEREFLITTRSFKNHREVINGTDDMHSYLIILNKSGEVLFKEEMAGEFSKLNCFIGDDDSQEIITVKTTWGKEDEKNGIYVYKWDEDKLIMVRKREFELPFFRFGNTTYCDIDNDGKKELFIITGNNELLQFDSSLEIVGRIVKPKLQSIFEIKDLDGEGNQEIITLSTDGDILVFDKNLKCLMRSNVRNMNKAKLAIYNPGFGKLKQLVIMEEGVFRFYEWREKRLFFNYYLVMILLGLAIVIYAIYNFLQISKQKGIYRRILAGSESAITIVNRKNKIIYYNPQFSELFGEDILAPKKLDDKNRLTKILKLELEKFKVLEDAVVRKSLDEPINDRYLEFVIRRLDKKSKLFMIKLRDRTDIVEMQEKSEWAEMARGLSHGIRRHLNNILLATEQISDSEDKIVKRLSPIILEEVSKLKYFVQSFQRFTELNKLQLQIVETNQFIDEYLKNQLPTMLGKIRFVSDLEHDLPKIEIDEIRFAEMLKNLITNAIEALEGTGKIIFRAYLRVENHKKQQVCLEICDTGEGIPEQIQNNVFLPYFTTKPGGTGIGLSLVKKMMKEFNGKIELESRKGIGTTIRLIFPVYEGERK